MMYQIQLNFESLLTISGTLFLIFLWSFYRSATTSPYKQFSKLPFLSLSSWSSLPLPIYRRWEGLRKGKKILQEVYQEQLSNNKPYALYGVFGDSVPLPTSMQEWLLAQPESHLSAKLAQRANLNTLTTLLNAHIVHNPVNQPRRNLIVHQELVARQMSEEVELALIDLMGSDSERFRVINVEYVVRRVISRAVNRVFVGPEICRNSDFIEGCLSYVSGVSTSGFLMNIFPTWLKSAVGSILTIPTRLAYRKCSSYLLPSFTHLISHTDELASPSTGLYSSWLVSNSTKAFPPSSLERTPNILSSRVMGTNFASTFTSAITTCNLVLDIFSHPDAAALLRDEVVSLNLKTEKNTDTNSWDHSQLKHLPRLDSALRESMRLWHLAPKSLARKVIHPDGITLPDNQHMPQGITLCISAWGVHHDQNLYPQPFEFIHDRFMPHSPEGEEKKTAAAVEPDGNFLSWGVGKHACPGRWFAVDLIKIVVGKILLNYEVEMLSERPENVWIEYNVIPPPSATLSVRRRKAHSVI